jgi:hypothetical protein
MISNYLELLAAVARWMHRSDLATVIPDFITLAESRVNRTVRPIDAETAVTLTSAINSSTIALPAGFSEALSLWLDEELQYIAPDLFEIEDTATCPWMWTVSGGNIQFDTKCDAIYSFRFRYKKKYDIANDTTNWLLTNHPDVYLFGALVEASPFIKDDARTAFWQARYDLAVSEVNANESRTRSLSKLAVDSALMGSRDSGILEG